jgi:hypothetical protein
MSSWRVELVGIVLAVVALVGCKSRADKTCASNGHKGPPGEVAGVWKQLELPLAGAEICKAEASGVTFILKNEKNFASTSERVQRALEAKGWVLDDLGQAATFGEGEASFGHLELLMAKEKKRIAIEVESYPRNAWKDDPVNVRVSKRTGPGIDTDW